jgi:surfactin synthase thioesterase subunit
MPQHIQTITVDSGFGVTTRNLFFHHEEPRSTRLVVLLPGRGYTTEHPVLYYLRKMAFARGYDVLSVEYGFQANNAELTPENIPYLQQDVAGAVAPVFERGYEHICVAGKSLGTPLAAELARRIVTDEVSLIQLTPIGGAMHGLGEIRTLAVIGTSDSLYSPEIVEAFRESRTVHWRVFEGLNHALEYDNDWGRSLDALREVMAACAEFLAACHE